MRCRSFDETAVAAVRRRGIQLAADVHRAALHVAHQPDRAVAVLDGLRLDHAGVVHRGLQQVARRQRGQQYLSAVGLDQAAVLRQRVYRALVHRDIEQAVPGQVQRHRVAGGQRHRAEFGGDHAFIADVRAQEGHIAAVGVDRSLIEYCSVACAGKIVFARHEVAVADAQGGRNQPAHVHLRPLAEQDAVRIHQEHFAVGRQAAEDARSIRTEHPVERDRTAVGLHEADRFCLSDAEALPVDRHILAGLVDRRLAGAAGDARVAGRHCAARRQGVDIRTEREHQGERQPFQGEARTSSHRACAGGGCPAVAFRVLGGGNKRASLVVPDRSVNAVHGVSPLFSRTVPSRM